MTQNFKNLPAKINMFGEKTVIQLLRVMNVKHRTKEILMAVLLGAIVPMICFRIAEHKFLPKERQEQAVTVIPETTASVSNDGKIPVLLSDGSVQIMPLNSYVTGVVLAEMPAQFDSEALKAQAVVARTYALKRISTGGKHSQNAVCTDSACCQAYMTVEAGIMSEDLIKKVKEAVEQTNRQVLTYNGTLIEATYFSCSGGKTEDALAVWGEQIPYLQSVESPGEEGAEYYVDTVSFSSEEFCHRIGKQLTGTPVDWIGEITYTTGGGVDTIQIDDERYSGTQIRKLLGLRSTAFFITAAGDTLTVTTKGYGHRVGMSQYGAEAMATTGNTYVQILAHYYPGTKLQQWQDN